MKVLAVDDDPLSLELLSAAMATVGYDDVTVARSAEEALRLAFEAEEPFGCFLIDILMPGTDGIELCRYLRRAPTYKATPIIMVTGMSARQYLDRAFAAGASDYITKPYDLTELGARARSAARQLAAEKRGERSAATVRALRAELEEARRVDLAEPMAMPEVEGAIDYLALENYLLRLGRGELATTALFTLQIARVDRLHRLASPTLFRDLLCDVADAILDAFAGSSCLLSYAGGGTFAVVGSGSGVDIDEVLVSVNQAATEFWLMDGDGQPLEVSLTAGAPEPFGVMTTGRGAVDMLRVAVERTRFGMAASDLMHMPRRRAGRGLIGSLLRAI